MSICPFPWSGCHLWKHYFCIIAWTVHRFQFLQWWTFQRLLLFGDRYGLDESYSSFFTVLHSTVYSIVMLVQLNFSFMKTQQLLCCSVHSLVDLSDMREMKYTRLVTDILRCIRFTDNPMYELFRLQWWKTPLMHSKAIVKVYDVHMNHLQPCIGHLIHVFRLNCLHLLTRKLVHSLR
jgi:hypothetical protein